VFSDGADTASWLTAAAIDETAKRAGHRSLRFPRGPVRRNCSPISRI
jgi:hypothetical protein